MSDAKANRDFVPVDDPKEALLLLKEGAKTLASAMVWTKNQEEVVNTHFATISEEEGVIYMWVPPAFDPKTFSQHLAELGTTECYFSVSLSRANVFFRAVFTGFDSGGMKFKLPEKVFKVQRRKDFRLPIIDGFVMKVEFQDPLFPEARLTKKVIDISAGGLAFVADTSEEPMYHAGLVLKKMTFTVDRRKIEVDAEVRHKREQPQGARIPGFKVGVIFVNLKPADADHIAKYVLQESRKYFTKFI